MEAEINKNDKRDNAIKEALKRRQKETLPSNFSFLLMERIQLEAIKQRKKRTIISWTSLIIATCLLIALGIYLLFFYMKVDFLGFINQIKMPQNAYLVCFYIYIALIVIALLCFDRWLRKKFS